MPSTVSRILGLLLCLGVLSPIGATAAEAADLATRFEHYTLGYQVNDDASLVESHDWAMTVLKERAVAQAKRASVTYSTSIQKAEVVEAYTRKADGRRIDSPRDNFQVEINTGRGKDAPVFSDQTTLTVVFPEVAVGDTVVFSYRITQSEPMFPGHFSASATFPPTAAYDDVRIRIDAPLSLDARYEARQLKEVTNREQDGRRLLEWRYENAQPEKNTRRNYSVYDPEKDPGFAYSTFKSYRDIAEAYGARARAKAAVTERVQALANEIAGDRKATRDIVHALYDWVATNISYAGNCIGVGAVVPHDISFVLDNRMGDCKDHATLLQALLAAKGIESSQALINAGSIYRLARIPAVTTVNHVINYIPSLDLYMDSTAESTPFGLLPFADTGKPVLLVDGYRDGARTPIVPIGTNEQSMRTVAEILPDGSVKGEVNVALKGMFAVTTRAAMRRLPKDQEDELVKNVFRSAGYVGSGTLDKDDPKDLIDSYRYGAKFTMAGFVQLPGSGAFAIKPFFFSEAPINAFLQSAVGGAEEVVDTVCSSGKSVEEYVFRLPNNMRILYHPTDMKIANDFVSYSATYRLKGNTLTVKRVLDDRTQTNVCSPDVAKAEREFAGRALQDVRAQVLFK